MATIKYKNGTKWDKIALVDYPIGSVYISYEDNTPADIFGGTWVKIENFFPYFGNNTDTGGKNSYTLTTNEMPEHRHSLLGYSIKWGYVTTGTQTVFNPANNISNASRIVASAGTNQQANLLYAPTGEGPHINLTGGGASIQQYACLPNPVCLETNCIDLRWSKWPL